MSLASMVLHAIQSNHLVQPGELVIAGVSGGPDSLCMLHVLRGLAAVVPFRLHAAHLNHMIRGAQADADAAFVEGVCRRWQVEYTIQQADVPLLARTRRLSLEEAARQARYAFLAQIAIKLGGQVVAVGHHADDQVETLLMHFLRGSGLSGLRGMQPRCNLSAEGIPGAADLTGQPDSASLRLIRPLLQVTRAQIDAYCAEHNLVPRVDESNRDTSLFRNRLRHELLPVLETYNPNIRQTLLHTAQVIGSDIELLDVMVGQAWRQTVKYSTPGSVVFDLASLRAQPLALQRALIRRGVNHINRSLRDFSFNQVESVIRVLEKGTTGKRVMLPTGIVFTLAYHEAVLSRGPEPQVPGYWPRFTLAQPVLLPLPGSYRNPQDGWILESSILPISGRIPDGLRGEPGTRACLALEKLDAPLVLTTRCPGDRLQPLGMGGRTQKLHDLMINARVPAADRQYVPVLRVNERIAWVIGLRQDMRFAVTNDTKQVVCLRVIPIEES